MTTPSNTSARDTKTRVSSYAYTALAGLAVAALLGTGAAAFRETGGWWLNFAVFTLAAAAPCLSLAWTIFAAPGVAASHTHPEDDTEGRWVEQATSGAFLDLITGAAVLLTATSVLELEISGVAVLFGTIVLGALDVCVRRVLTGRRTVTATATRDHDGLRENVVDDARDDECGE